MLAQCPLLAAFRMQTPQASGDPMTLRNFHTACIVPALLLLASLASAQATIDGVIPINGGKNVVFVKPNKRPVTPATAPTAGLIPIYTNLGQGSNVYSGIAGSGLLGKDTGMMWPEWLACGFTPTADHLVYEVRVGVSHVTGADPVTVSINEDINGTPGKILHAWQFSGLPDFGTCCTIQTGRVKPGIPLKGGQMYWLTIRTLLTNPDTYDVWNNDFNGENGPFANSLGSGWINEGIQQLGAFGVFGQ
jgi:hypothetical protein